MKKYLFEIATTIGDIVILVAVIPFLYEQFA